MLSISDAGVDPLLAVIAANIAVLLSVVDAIPGSVDGISAAVDAGVMTDRGPGAAGEGQNCDKGSESCNVDWCFHCFPWFRLCMSWGF